MSETPGLDAPVLAASQQPSSLDTLFAELKSTVREYRPNDDLAPLEAEPAGHRRTVTVLPTPVTFAGQAASRWWQLEDRAVDIGGFAPDRSHLATMLLIDVALAHSDDWFQFAVPPPFNPGQPDPPSSGVLVKLSNVTVMDTFDQVWPLQKSPRCLQ